MTWIKIIGTKFIVIVFLLKTHGVLCQRIVNQLPSSVLHKNFHQIGYDNDLFAGTDYYYTQGFIYKVANEKLSNFFLHKLLFGIKNKEQIHGIALESTVYTPTSITALNVLDSDRPYAATLTLNFSKINSDSIGKFKFSTEIIAGVMGPSALGKEQQTAIHKLTNNDEPQGWKYQLRNSFLLNYNAEVTKHLFDFLRITGIYARAGAQIGTLSDRISLGTETRSKDIVDLLSKEKRRTQLYIYTNVIAHFVFYDATLQGGVFTNNIYDLSYKDIKKGKMELHFGLQLVAGKFTLGFDYGQMSKEFELGLAHSWAGLNLTFYR